MSEEQHSTHRHGQGRKFLATANFNNPIDSQFIFQRVADTDKYGENAYYVIDVFNPSCTTSIFNNGCK